MKIREGGWDQPEYLEGKLRENQFTYRLKILHSRYTANYDGGQPDSWRNQGICLGLTSQNGNFAPRHENFTVRCLIWAIVFETGSGATVKLRATLSGCTSGAPMILLFPRRLTA
jgi:hypothetical protein